MTAAATQIPKGARLKGTDRQKFIRDITAKYTAGASVREIATETGRAYGSIHRMLVENDVTLRGRGGANRKATKS
jgi:predicted transcriptional regulator